MTYDYCILVLTFRKQSVEKLVKIWKQNPRLLTKNADNHCEHPQNVKLIVETLVRVREIEEFIRNIELFVLWRQIDNEKVSSTNTSSLFYFTSLSMLKIVKHRYQIVVLDSQYFLVKVADLTLRSLQLNNMSSW